MNQITPKVKPQLTDCGITHERFFIFQHSVNGQFFTILSCYDGNRWLLVWSNCWHLLDDLMKQRTLIARMNIFPFKQKFTLISVSSWWIRVKELNAIDLIIPRLWSDSMIWSTSSSDQPWLLRNRKQNDKNQHSIRSKHGIWFDAKFDRNQTNLIKSKALCLPCQIFWCNWVWISLFDEFNHFFGGQWHNFELWIFEWNCKQKSKQNNITLD